MYDKSTMSTTAFVQFWRPTVICRAFRGKMIGILELSIRVGNACLQVCAVISAQCEVTGIKASQKELTERSRRKKKYE
jgi:hypothetical protein